MTEKEIEITQKIIIIAKKTMMNKPPLNFEDECCVCGTKKKLIFHHLNYIAPIKLTILCHKCHRKVHGYLTTNS